MEEEQRARVRSRFDLVSHRLRPRNGSSCTQPTPRGRNGQTRTRIMGGAKLAAWEREWREAHGNGDRGVLEIPVTGMKCEHCVKKVTGA